MKDKKGAPRKTALKSKKASSRVTAANWEGAAAAGNGMDVGAEMSRLTLAIAGLTLFSRDPSQDAERAGAPDRRGPGRNRRPCVA